MTRADLAVLGRTVVQLRPAQLAHRARLRTQRAGLRRFPEAGRLIMPGPDPGAAVGLPDAARPVDALTPGCWPGRAELRTGKIRPVRRHERSTAALSTVQVDAADSTEVWGVFRAGRRARVSGLAVHTDAARVTCEAVHDGFRALRGRPLHHRRWSLASGELRVEDTVTGQGRHEIVIRWQLAAGSTVWVADRTALVTGPAGDFSVTVAATAPVWLAAETRAVAAGFGSTADAPALTCRMDAELAVGVTTVWSRARGGAGGERAT